MESFDIPVCLFFFCRTNTTVQIIERIAEVRPRKLYLIADGPRNSSEEPLVEECRREVEKRITWDCEVIYNYASQNRGVYAQIGEGAKWVFSQEKEAIFLEDDNLPETTFFPFCREMLERYRNDNRILWICGTNYLEEYKPADGASYMFTRHLLPCGWASWASKFPVYYDGDMSLFQQESVRRNLPAVYSDNPALGRQQELALIKTLYAKQNKRPYSWDFQMAFSIRCNGLWGISPVRNQIRNIGVDAQSTHGGTSFRYVMTRRFCGMGSLPLEFPLRHPPALLPDAIYEKKIGNLILYPLSRRILLRLAGMVKKLIGVSEAESLSRVFKAKLNQSHK